MALKLLGRIATLLKADAHGVVESLEERSLLLKQYLREAEIALHEARARLAALRDDEQRLGEALAAQTDAMPALEQDIALALAAGKDDLARFAIRRLLRRRAAAQALQAQLAQRRAEAQGLAERVTAQEAAFEELRTRVRAELARTGAADAAATWTAEPAVADEEVEIELMRRRQAQDGAP